MSAPGERARPRDPDGAPAGAPSPETRAPTDAELVARVLARDDRHAFAQLVRRHHSMVRTLLRRLACGDAALADDLAQESFLRAFKGLARWRAEGRISSWLYRVAYNVFLAHHARARREPVASLEPDDSAAEAAEPDPAADRALLQHDLERAMAALSPPERAALTLAYRDGLSHGEVALVLDCPLGTAKSHILRGKEKLKRQLDGWRGDPP